MSTTAADPIIAKHRAAQAWKLHCSSHPRIRSTLGTWTNSTAADGTPMLSCRVTGPDARDALQSWARDHTLFLSSDGDQRPTFDYSVPGRVTCVWRTGGVWIEMWHPDTPKPTPAIVAALVASRTSPGILRRFSPSGRLPITRTRKERTK
ncbi:hypothetical protein [Streptomyces sp. NPDC005877]|uniref:hypothetical protein n=1 Tax=Streptomyces sp. NPDC005877 TaxID=3155346 RepID=UPI00340156F4